MEAARGPPKSSNLYESDVNSALGNDEVTRAAIRYPALSRNRIARDCRRIIFQNFFGTLIVDTIGIGLAAVGLLNPLLAAFIHVASEVDVHSKFDATAAAQGRGRGCQSRAGSGTSLRVVTMRNRSGSVSISVVTVLLWILVLLITFFYIRALRNQPIWLD